MKVAVIYSSKAGTTKICAEYLSERIIGSQLVDLNEQTPDISEFEAVFIGSGIRMGKLYKPVREFLKKNAELLKTKKTVLFVSNFYPKTVSKTIQKNVPEELIREIDILECGGVAPFNKITDHEWLKKEAIDTALAKIGLV